MSTLKHSNVYKFAPGDEVVDKQTKERGRVLDVRLVGTGSSVAIITVFFYRKNITRNINVLWGRSAPVIKTAVSNAATAVDKAVSNIKSRTESRIEELFGEGFGIPSSKPSGKEPISLAEVVSNNKSVNVAQETRKLRRVSNVTQVTKTGTSHKQDAVVRAFKKQGFPDDVARRLGNLYRPGARRYSSGDILDTAAHLDEAVESLLSNQDASILGGFFGDGPTSKIKGSIDSLSKQIANHENLLRDSGLDLLSSSKTELSPYQKAVYSNLRKLRARQARYRQYLLLRDATLPSPARDQLHQSYDILTSLRGLKSNVPAVDDTSAHRAFLNQFKQFYKQVHGTDVSQGTEDLLTSLLRGGGVASRNEKIRLLRPDLAKFIGKVENIAGMIVQEDLMVPMVSRIKSQEAIIGPNKRLVPLLSQLRDLTDQLRDIESSPSYLYTSVADQASLEPIRAQIKIAREELAVLRKNPVANASAITNKIESLAKLNDSLVNASTAISRASVPNINSTLETLGIRHKRLSVFADFLAEVEELAHLGSQANVRSTFVSGITPVARQVRGTVNRLGYIGLGQQPNRETALFLEHLGTTASRVDKTKLNIGEDIAEQQMNRLGLGHISDRSVYEWYLPSLSQHEAVESEILENASRLTSRFDKRSVKRLGRLSKSLRRKRDAQWIQSSIEEAISDDMAQVFKAPNQYTKQSLVQTRGRQYLLHSVSVDTKALQYSGNKFNPSNTVIYAKPLPLRTGTLSFNLDFSLLDAPTQVTPPAVSTAETVADSYKVLFDLSEDVVIKGNRFRAGKRSIEAAPTVIQDILASEKTYQTLYKQFNLSSFINDSLAASIVGKGKDLEDVHSEIYSNYLQFVRSQRTFKTGQSLQQSAEEAILAALHLTAIENGATSSFSIDSNLSPLSKFGVSDSRVKSIVENLRIQNASQLVEGSGDLSDKIFSTSSSSGPRYSLSSLDDQEIFEGLIPGSGRSVKAAQLKKRLDSMRRAYKIPEGFDGSDGIIDINEKRYVSLLKRYRQLQSNTELDSIESQFRARAESVSRKAIYSASRFGTPEEKILAVESQAERIKSDLMLLQRVEEMESSATTTASKARIAQIKASILNRIRNPELTRAGVSATDAAIPLQELLKKASVVNLSEQSSADQVSAVLDYVKGLTQEDRAKLGVVHDARGNLVLQASLQQGAGNPVKKMFFTVASDGSIRVTDSVTEFSIGSINSGVIPLEKSDMMARVFSISDSKLNLAAEASKVPLLKYKLDGSDRYIIDYTGKGSQGINQQIAKLGMLLDDDGNLSLSSLASVDVETFASQRGKNAIGHFSATVGGQRMDFYNPEYTKKLRATIESGDYAEWATHPSNNVNKMVDKVLKLFAEGNVEQRQQAISRHLKRIEELESYGVVGLRDYYKAKIIEGTSTAVTAGELDTRIIGFINKASESKSTLVGMNVGFDISQIQESLNRLDSREAPKETTKALRRALNRLDSLKSGSVDIQSLAGILFPEQDELTISNISQQALGQRIFGPGYKELHIASTDDEQALHMLQSSSKRLDTLTQALGEGKQIVEDAADEATGRWFFHSTTKRAYKIKGGYHLSKSKAQSIYGVNVADSYGIIAEEFDYGTGLKSDSFMVPGYKNSFLRELRPYLNDMTDEDVLRLQEERNRQAMVDKVHAIFSDDTTDTYTQLKRKSSIYEELKDLHTKENPTEYLTQRAQYLLDYGNAEGRFTGKYLQEHILTNNSDKAGMRLASEYTSSSSLFEKIKSILEEFDSTVSTGSISKRNSQLSQLFFEGGLLPKESNNMSEMLGNTVLDNPSEYQFDPDLMSKIQARQVRADSVNLIDDVESSVTKGRSIQKLSNLVNNVMEKTYVKAGIGIGLAALAAGVTYSALVKPELGQEENEQKARLRGDHAIDVLEKNQVNNQVMTPSVRDTVVHVNGQDFDKVDSTMLNNMVSKVMSNNVDAQQYTSSIKDRRKSISRFTLPRWGNQETSV